MPLVMLKKDWPGTFRRNVRNTAGAVTETLTFEPGVPEEVPYDKLPVIAGDLFKSLFPITLNNGKPVEIEESVFREEIETTPEVTDAANNGRRSRK